MAFEVHWLTPCRIIDLKLSGRMTRLEIVAAHGALSALLDEGRPPVHVLTDISTLVVTPQTLLWHREAASIFDHPSLGWWTGYGKTSLVFQYIAESILRLRVVRYVLTATREDALVFLIEHDPTLKEEIPRRV